MSLYPIVIVEDRYTGSYSRGTWIAFANAYGDPRESLDCGAFSDDGAAANYWADEDRSGLVGRGDSPDKALADLRQRFAEKEGIS